ncbi:hypothetical protein ACFV1C_00605 [Streptomyces sp. NPDC059605]|uniref:hypothetical protein n=1 Tax=Streptomyces sp. NPDC059605 TaxID=3346882 RepID=UPI0036BF82D8
MDDGHAPAPADEAQEQHIADLRAALQRALSWLAFCAGLEASDPARWSEMLLAEVHDGQAVLDKTALK